MSGTSPSSTEARDEDTEGINSSSDSSDQVTLSSSRSTLRLSRQQSSSSGSSSSSHYPTIEDIGATISPEEVYEVGERVFAFHRERIYEAKILEVKRSKPKQAPTTYLIHYQGWKDRWDEVVPPSRLLKYTPANKLLESKVSQAYTQQKAGKR